ncbi:MAG: ATP-binding protein [Acidobacteriota bacterium]
MFWPERPVISRPFWREKLHRAWASAPVVWLTGVRRIGKTTIARELANATFLNCDLPSTRRRLEDPERFYPSMETPLVIFDEIHRLPDPSQVLKIAADEFGRLRILATGSSTLAATTKFRDTLTGRKRTVHLLPVLHRELAAFGVSDLRRRLLHGGLPEPLLSRSKDPEFFAEWLDSFYARDIQELFRVGKRQEFLRLLELVLRTSGSLLEATSLAKHCGLSRPTVLSYLDVLQLTHVLVLLRPFHGGGRQEILRQPKVYGFDTGFVSFCRGWERLREQDCGLLWEHLVLETLVAQGPRRIHYWRDKQKREVDFVLPHRAGQCDAIECKWKAESFSSRSLRAFRASHPEGLNFVISPQSDPAYVREVDRMTIVFCNLEQWASGETTNL